MTYSWKKDLFDSDILGFPVAKIESIDFDTDKNAVRSLLTELQKENISYATFRLHSENFSLIHELEKSGFMLVDGLLSLEMSLKSFEKKDIPQQIRIATNDDIPQLKVLAEEVFYLNRLYNDPYILKEKANIFYAQWVENSVIKKAADGVYIWEENNTIVGFATYKKTGDIPLLGVKKDFRGKGISRKLIWSIFDYFISQGINNATIETQMANISAIRSYQSCGFKISDSHVTFSWHADR